MKTVFLNPNKQEQDFKAAGKTALVLEGEQDAHFLTKRQEIFLQMITSSPKSLRYLSIVNCNLTTQLLYDIAHSLSQTCLITSLILDSNNLTQSASPTLIVLLTQCSKLSELSLANNPFGDTALSQILLQTPPESLSNLETLNLKKTKIGDRTIHVLLFTMKDNLPSLTSCVIGSNPDISEESALKLHKLIIRRSVNTMDQLWNQIQEIDRSRQFQTTLHQIGELQVSDGDLTDWFDTLKSKPIIQNGEMLLKNSILKILNPNFQLHQFLRYSTLLLQMSDSITNLQDYQEESRANEKQFQMLEQYLHFVGTLKIQYLDISGNELSPSQSKGFMESLLVAINATNLKVINLNNNIDLRLEGVITMLQSLTQAKNLEAIFLDNTGLHEYLNPKQRTPTSKQISSITQFLKSHKKLMIFSVAKNIELSGSLTASILAEVAKHKSLKVLDLSGGSISQESSEKHLHDFYQRTDSRVVIWTSLQFSSFIKKQIPHILIQVDGNYTEYALLNVKYALIREIDKNQIKLPNMPIEGNVKYYWVRAFREGNNKILMMQLIEKVADYRTLQQGLTLSRSNKQFKEEGVWALYEGFQIHHPFALIFDVFQISLK